ncbi:Glycosyltransferase involved in cell wall bisynthesis [Prosthecobacter debontii]|uniref:Glycosyltransferase involved in cell wall bisynthesis n=2 Tax=Prosthecobacter debontii TaxID=48467 RepID=A0A1T4YVU6_9BACT|nr:Glycosyltransferase involved in cell wall bisynthesis [Prosthecobacter debontii]
MKLRVLLGFVSYGPYHLARLKACQETCSDWDVFGWELSATQSEYGWERSEEDHIFSVTEECLESVKSFRWLGLVWSHLQALNPDVCFLAGYSHPGMLAALLWCCVHRRKAIIMSDSKADDAPRKPWLEWFKGRLLALYDAALVAGAPHRRYFTQLGMPSSLIHEGYDVVDNAAYAKPQPRPPLQRPYFLSISRFIPKKNLTTLLSAYSDYAHALGYDQAWSLVICGEGALRRQLEQQIAEAQLGELVSLLGFLQMKELMPYLAHAKALVHASSQEQWGLVVNEAQATGIPVIVSRNCGCFEDLVEEDVNGFGFSAGDRAQLTHLLIQMHALPETKRQAMGEAGKQKINLTHSLERFAASVRSCVQSALTAFPSQAC